MAGAALLGARPRAEVWDGPVIDVDVHAVVPSLEALTPYLSDVMHTHIKERGWMGPIDTYTYPPGLSSSVRAEWQPSDGRKAATDVELLREHVLDPWDVDRAIVNCYYPLDAGHPDVAASLASAINDWLVAEWLDRDERLRASIVLPGRDPVAMAREVDRVGGHPGFVQALCPVRSGRMYGQRPFRPLCEALVRHDLVMGIHYGGLNDGLPPTPNGWPSWYSEEYAAEMQNFESQIMGLIAGGVFAELPDLRVSILEGGFLWLPSWGWRLDKEWKGMRREIPWVDRSPLTEIREHMRFSTAPIDAGPPAEVARTIGFIKSEDLLMFASDYPHDHDDDLAMLLDTVPETQRPKLMAESAREWYRL
jgi:predicted TIM-barrel fold metal-dependent hydrolase